VVNGIAIISYNITLSARTYDITAVYTNTGYNRIEAKTQLTITKSNMNIKCDPIITTTDTTTIQGQILNKNKENINRNITISIKINNQTITTTKIENGTINITIPTQYKAGNYILEIIAGETNTYNSDRLTTVLVKK